MIKLKRVYAPPAKGDGFRILVDRLWPRGLSKESAAIDHWLKEIGPSTSLRKWFDHDPNKWRSFKEKYENELKRQDSLVRELQTLEDDRGTITLLYGAKSEEYNQAVVLKDFIARK
jgi:uncharacterized protein YeaO (DUF488 family)